MDKTKEKPANKMTLIGTNLCKKSDLGIHNNLFGGTMLSWIDEAAVAFCAEVCFTPNLVTLKLDEVTFKAPVKENNLIKLYGEVIKVGGSTITIHVEARKFNVYTHEETTVTDTKLIFVRIDEDGKPVPIAEHVRERFETVEPELTSDHKNETLSYSRNYLS